MIITVFGAAYPDGRGYEEAYELGKKIAQAGHTLKNGGYTGTMEAAAKGCNEYRGKSIGVCLEGHFGNTVNPNEFLSEVIIKEDLTGRVVELLKTDYIIVLKGEVGTLAEWFKVWVDQCVVKEGKIHVVGEKNKRLLTFLEEEGFIHQDKQLPYIEYVNTIEELTF